MHGLLALFSSSRSSLKLFSGLASVCSASSLLLVVLSSLEKLFLSLEMEGCASPLSSDIKVHKLCISCKCCTE